MPVKSGASHVLASAVALLMAPLVREVWLEIIDGEDILRAIEAASNILAEHPFVPAGGDALALILTLGTILLLVYVHGHVYHVLRQESE